MNVEVRISSEEGYLAGGGVASFPYGRDENGDHFLITPYNPNEWVHIWNREVLVDGTPYRVRVSVMEVNHSLSRVTPSSSPRGEEVEAAEGESPTLPLLPQD